jgi:acetyl-CoA acyltransferase 1
MIASKIKCGLIKLGLAAGVESMSQSDMSATVDPEKLSDAFFDHEVARECMIPMGNTSEAVAEKYGLARKELDEFAAHSYAKAELA